MFNKRGDPEFRAGEIARAVREFDLIGFNEVFDDVPRERLLSELRRHWGSDYHAVHGPPSAGKNRYNGGLAIASKYPIVASHHEVYADISRIKDHGFGADEFASKGVLHARIRATGPKEKAAELDCFVTHLDANEHPIRQKEIAQMANFIRQHAGASNAVFILGDFNTRGDPRDVADPHSYYRQMMAKLRGGLPGHRLADTWIAIGSGDGGTNRQGQKTGGNRIDYIFFANPADSPNALRPESIRVEPFLHPKTFALSDHSAVAASFAWRFHP